MLSRAYTSLPAPAPELATAYVTTGINQVGGLREALGGLRHSTLPALLGVREKFGFGTIFVLFSRALILIATALFPLLVRKSIVPHEAEPPDSMLEACRQILVMLQSATHLDYVFGLIAIGILAGPKVFGFFEKKPAVQPHSPFYELTPALRKIPILPDAAAQDVEEALRLTLLALRDEMALLIGDTTSRRVTDVSLLEFCDSNGARMQVRARTANHEGVRRPIDAGRLVAYYVAKAGQSFVEHDFRNKRNPFPPRRVSVIGGPEIDYRSVLYIPICYTEILGLVKDGFHGASQVVDSCGGVICVHSSKPYRFWRWGDHKKGVGGFADVAFSRAMPYIALVEKLLSCTAHKVKLEVK